MRYESVEEAKDYLLDRMGSAPDLAIIMGSGISATDEILRDTTHVHYITIPHFPVPSVSGHRGQAVFGRAGKLKVLVFEGRVHSYEGKSMDEVAFCARVVGRTGAKAVLLTNAAGAINPDYRPGQFMMIKDHINLLGKNPLTGPNDDRWGPRFVDQAAVYDAALQSELREAAAYCGIFINEGVYAALAGPTYETPAEVRYLQAIGADAVGMSTVPEAIVARHMGVRVAGISLLTNAAGGQSGAPIRHADVLDLTATMHADLGMLLQRFLETHTA